jgi:hypothetical protein
MKGGYAYLVLDGGPGPFNMSVATVSSCAHVHWPCSGELGEGVGSLDLASLLES